MILTSLTVPANFRIVDVSPEADAISVLRFLQFKTTAACGLSEMCRFIRIMADMIEIVRALDVDRGVDRVMNAMETIWLFVMAG